LTWGTLPGLLKLDDPEDKAAFLRAYTLTYIREEIIAEQAVRNLEPFRMFLEVAAQSNGKIVNYSKVASDVGVSVKTAISYFSILEETLVGYLLPAYHRSVRKQQLKHPKFYYFDTGVAKALSRTLEIPLAEKTYAYGEAFEHYIICEFFRLAGYLKPDWRLSYLNTAGGAEIDLIIDRPGQQDILIEIKSTKEVKEHDVRVLAELAADFENAKAYCLSRSTDVMIIKDVRCLNYKDGLAEIFKISEK